MKSINNFLKLMGKGKSTEADATDVESSPSEGVGERRDFLSKAVWGGIGAATASTGALANHEEVCGSGSSHSSGDLSLNFGSITGLPSTFPPSSHSHNEYVKHSETGSFARSSHTHNEFALKGDVSSGGVEGVLAVAAEPNSIAKRDSSGRLIASKFLGRATSAEWADLAEKYNPDKFYEEGFILAVGGEKEVTLFQEGMPLAGVVSYYPGYELNNKAETEGWNYICLKGRVPVKIKGNARKGDYILAYNDGLGIAQKEISTLEDQRRVIGIALEDGESQIEVKI